MNDPVVITLTPIEADKFVAFQKYYEIFQKLEEQSAFDLQFGKVTFNFAHGILQNVIKESVVYKR